MYIFTRSTRLKPDNMRSSMTWAVEITEKVNQISEARFSLWRPLFSPNATRLIWGTMVEELEELEAIDAKLMADDGYLSLLDKGAQHSAGDPIDDTLVSFLHGDFASAADVQVISVVEATLANGSFAKGIEVGVEIAQRAEQISGLPTAFGIHSTGAYGRVQWVSGTASVAEMQKGESKVNSDPSFLQLLDTKAADVFIPGSGEQRVARRIM